MMRYSWFRKLVLSKTKKTGFPDWVSKTDEENSKCTSIVELL